MQPASNNLMMNQQMFSGPGVMQQPQNNMMQPMQPANNFMPTMQPNSSQGFITPQKNQGMAPNQAVSIILYCSHFYTFLYNSICA